jgi:AmiR/NasT family two-component response regulator
MTSVRETISLEAEIRQLKEKLEKIKKLDMAKGP